MPVETRKTAAAAQAQSSSLGGMTFEQRVILIRRLHDLKERNNRDLHEWLVELRHTLSSVEAVRPLVEALPSLPVTAEESRIEKQTCDIIRIAIRLVESHPVAVFGGDARHLVAERVGEELKSHPLIRTARWLLPTIGVLLFGGTLWGSYQIKSVTDIAAKASRDIGESQDKVFDAAQKASRDITALSSQLVTSWNDKIKAEAQAQLKELTTSVSNANLAAAQKIEEQLRIIESAGAVGRRSVEEATSAQKEKLTRLADERMAETTALVEGARAKVQAITEHAPTQVAALLNDFEQWASTKRGEVTETSVAASTAIRERRESAIADLGTRTDAAAMSIASQLTAFEQRLRDAETQEFVATSGARKKVDEVLASIDTTRGEVASKLRDGLSGIDGWLGEERRKMDDALFARRTELSQAGTAQARVIEDAGKAAKDSLDPVVDAAKAQIDTARGQAVAQVQASTNEIARLADTKRTEINATAAASLNLASEFRSSMDQAKHAGAVQVQNAVREITDWGASQRTTVGKELDAQKASVVTDMMNQQNDIRNQHARVGTEFTLLLNDVRTGSNELAKRLVGLQDQQNKLHEQQSNLHEQLQQQRPLLGVVESLRLVIERADQSSQLSFATLVRLLEWKDAITIGAGLASLLALALVAFGSLRQRGGRAPESTTELGNAP